MPDFKKVQRGENQIQGRDFLVMGCLLGILGSILFQK